MTNAQPGWYVDPSGSTHLRWWNGYEWTSETAPAPATRERLSLPWLAWAPWLAAIAASALICFDKAESRSSARPGLSALVGMLLVVVLTFAAAILTLRERRWVTALFLAGLVAGVVSFSLFAVASPSASRDCKADSECDASFGMGLPFLATVLAVPSLVVTSTGWVVRAKATSRNDYAITADLARLFSGASPADNVASTLRTCRPDTEQSRASKRTLSPHYESRTRITDRLIRYSHAV